MSDTLGKLTVWGLFLGTTQVVAKEAIPFVISSLGLCLVLVLLVSLVNEKPPRNGGGA